MNIPVIIKETVFFNKKNLIFNFVSFFKVVGHDMFTILKALQS